MSSPSSSPTPTLTPACESRALAQAIAAIPLVVGGERVRLSASWGVRGFEPDMSADQMLAEADAAMFVRKGSRAR